MKTTLELNRILVFSEPNNKYFFTEFQKGLNVIYGRNTAGKSTLIQLILFTFGINDNKIKLAEILSEEIFIRLDCSITQGNEKLNYTFIRQDDTLLVRNTHGKVIRFNGVGSDQSYEHVKLKHFFHELFHFDLKLESKSGISEAPIETIFLPYYVSQDVGWVYLRKSFNNLTFYRGFKEDFLDYYLGIEDTTDKEAKRLVEIKIKGLQQQANFLSEFERDNKELEVSKTVDETISGKANDLLETISSNRDELLKLEKKYMKDSDLLSFYTQRSAVVSKVSRNHEHQFPGSDSCPTCAQTLPVNLEKIYTFYQAENDSQTLKLNLKEKVKKLQSDLNSTNKKIENYRKHLQENDKIYQSYSSNNVTLDSWIKNKANIQLRDGIVSQIGQIKIDIDEAKEELKDFKTEDQILAERAKKNALFKNSYIKKNGILGVPIIDDDRFYKVYELSSFPFQGVELHKAVLSYHFAFNELISKTDNVHRLPFFLDGVFKEDLDANSKTNILKFIVSNIPSDTQTIMSIADHKEEDSKIEEYSNEIFGEVTNLICIGNGIEQKALLTSYDGSHRDIVDDSYGIIDTF